MMTSSNGNIFRVSGPLCREYTGHWWIPHTKVSDAEHVFSLIYAWINGWVKRQRTLIVMDSSTGTPTEDHCSGKRQYGAAAGNGSVAVATLLPPDFNGTSAG